MFLSGIDLDTTTSHELQRMDEKIHEILPLLIGDLYPPILRYESYVIKRELERRNHG